MGKTISIIPLLMFSQTLWGQSPTDTVYTLADQMPYFQGCKSLDNGTEAKRRCSEEAMIKFIAGHLVYPEAAKQAGVQGTVYVSFIVDEWGAVVQPTLLMDIGSGCGEEALKVIAAMPPWEPAHHAGQAVRVKLNLPIQFALKDNETGDADGYQLSWGTLRGQSTTTEELRKNIHQTVSVRDPLGNSRYIDELAFTFVKKKKLLNATSRGTISQELRRIVEKAKKGGTFTITASVQERGKFIYVTRSFDVLE
jgi:TonB family protein